MKARNFLRQLLLRRRRDQSRDFDLEIMSFRERRRRIAIGVLGNHVIGGRRRIGEHHRRLALGEQPIGLLQPGVVVRMRGLSFAQASAALSP